ncbi:MAG: HPr kinase/phosphorylase [Devosiaceae bacterium]
MNITLPTIHATALLLGGMGVLIRGTSGAGKSRLALALLDREGCQPSQRAYLQRDAPHALISDDQVHLEQGNGGLIARSPSSLSGRLEVRGIGIVHMPWVEAARMQLIVDLTSVDLVPRMPESNEERLQGCLLTRIHVPIGDLAHQCLLVRCALSLLTR